jgi:hypothetical protein
MGCNLREILKECKYFYMGIPLTQVDTIYGNIKAF